MIVGSTIQLIRVLVLPDTRIKSISTAYSLSGLSDHPFHHKYKMNIKYYS
ncbi:hypothetical protein Cal6303_1192 [Calothrix sp. PCC 6303]|nr:hypothetical protein Cal6303_1192 [Calothrix sp. PCC 6303]